MKVYVTCATSGDPVRRSLQEATLAHWRSLGIDPRLQSYPGSQRVRFEAVRDDDPGDLFVLADDDCFLRPRAMKLRHADPIETWDQFVERQFAADPKLGMAAAIPQPEFPFEIPQIRPGHGPSFFFQTLPQDQWEVWSTIDAVGGIRFIRREALAGDLPDGTDPLYDYVLCQHLRAKGWTVGYFPHLQCHHLGHGLSFSRDSPNYRATCYRP